MPFQGDSLHAMLGLVISHHRVISHVISHCGYHNRVISHVISHSGCYMFVRRVVCPERKKGVMGA